MLICAMKMYCVYLIQDSSGPIKIGYSGNLTSRLSATMNGNPRPLIVLQKIECDDKVEAKELETKIHYHFKDKRIRGEWFNLDQKDLNIFGTTFFQTFSDPNMPKGWSIRQQISGKFTAALCKKMREAKNITRLTLAKDASIGHQTLINFENGSTANLQDETLQRLIDAFQRLGVEFDPVTGRYTVQP